MWFEYLVMSARDGLERYKNGHEIVVKCWFCCKCCKLVGQGNSICLWEIDCLQMLESNISSFEGNMQKFIK